MTEGSVRAMLNYEKLYIDGSWVAPAGAETLE
jgi:hypothetical protein